jgi:hypothetical protein
MLPYTYVASPIEICVYFDLEIIPFLGIKILLTQDRLQNKYCHNYTVNIRFFTVKKKREINKPKTHNISNIILIILASF